MKEKIEAKINEVLDYIMSKDVKDITYKEYFILDSKLSAIKWEESQDEKNREMAGLMTRMFSTSTIQRPLPTPTEED